jgi:hypothetical protein
LVGLGRAEEEVDLECKVCWREIGFPFAAPSPPSFAGEKRVLERIDGLL